MNKKTLSPLAAALGTTFVVSLAASPVTQAATNPFAMHELSNGYMQVAEGNCGDKKDDMKTEDSSGGKMDDQKKAEGNCGDKKEEMKEEKKAEGNCGH